MYLESKSPFSRPALAVVLAVGLLGSVWIRDNRASPAPGYRTLTDRSGAYHVWGANYPYLQSADIGELYCVFSSEYTTASVIRSEVTIGNALGSQQDLSGLCRQLRKEVKR